MDLNGIYAPMDQMKTKQRILSVWFSTELRLFEGESVKSISEGPRWSGLKLSSVASGGS